MFAPQHSNRLISQTGADHSTTPSWRTRTGTHNTPPTPFSPSLVILLEHAAVSNPFCRRTTIFSRWGLFLSLWDWSGTWYARTSYSLPGYYHNTYTHHAPASELVNSIVPVPPPGLRL
ncbi:hypothetical protein CPSG_06239 [Coccidioides posadasii str. Silveira]|uniref:Uncharacterized protein n=1 Tax=Coccidioides posadasii (strain RMSCC 757 / Silveira) TaxID=443226 RepID=E9D8T7_COCPS|nr:hypothetical protein CPSG_06239 [Coccidioides posadasii str. Silveira]